MPSRMTGFGLLELMIAMGLGLVVTAGVLAVFIAEQQVYNNSSSQSQMQDIDNAISATVTPVARGTGFLGCGVIDATISNEITGAATPLTFNASSAVQGYTGTVSTGFQFVDGTANDLTAGDWSPSLDSSITTTTATMKGVEKGNDVLVLMGAVPGSSPIGLTAPLLGSPFSVSDSTPLTNVTSTGPWPVGMSNCMFNYAFLITAIAGTKLTFVNGPNGTPQIPVGTQLVPLQQTMFYIGAGDSGQSALFQATMTIPASGVKNASWTSAEMVPGVLAMKVLYGTGSGGQATQYLDASAITNWQSVTSIRLAFLVEGGTGSVSKPSTAQTYTLLNSTITVPADTRMRHVFYMTINTRNSTL